MAKRYLQLLTLIAETKPVVIVEVGVHHALRGVMMCEQALLFQPYVSYIGFDVFETKSAQFQNDALNGKGMATERVAAERMKALARHHSTFSWQFVVGDTRDTLHGKHIAADFAFIDGDHRVEAIRGDAAALVCPVIVFDDYYLGSGGPDLSKYGANAVVDEMAGSVLPIADKCNHGAMAHLAVVKRIEARKA